MEDGLKGRDRWQEDGLRRRLPERSTCEVVRPKEGPSTLAPGGGGAPACLRLVPSWGPGQLQRAQVGPSSDASSRK